MPGSGRTRSGLTAGRGASRTARGFPAGPGLLPPSPRLLRGSLGTRRGPEHPTIPTPHPSSGFPRPPPPALPPARPAGPRPARPHLLQEAGDIVDAPVDNQPGLAVGVPLPHLLQREHGPGRLLRAAPGLRPLPALHAARW